MEAECKVAIKSERDIVVARQKGRAMARDFGFSISDATLIATAISELARNIIAYAREGMITMNFIYTSKREGLLIVASDEGPGIADIPLALRDGFLHFRQPGNWFTRRAPPDGRVRYHFATRRRNDCYGDKMETLDHPLVEYGVANLTLPGEGTSGDIHVLRSRPGGLLVAAIDGIGHGEEAAGAAKTAASILANGADQPIISLVEECHRSLQSTRGVVLSAASIDFDHGMMTWLGVGNVVGALARVVPPRVEFSGNASPPGRSCRQAVAAAFGRRSSCQRMRHSLHGHRRCQRTFCGNGLRA